MTTFREQLKGRYATLGLIALAVLGTLATQLWNMQVIHGSDYATAAEQNRVREVSLPAARGRILDTQGRPLVTNRAVVVVTASSAISQDTTLVARLSSVIGVPVATIQKRLSSYKQERLAPHVLRIDVPMDVAAYLAEHAVDFPGVAVEESAVREYPFGSLGAHVLGYTGEISEEQLADKSLPDAQLGDIVGKTGVEAYYDEALQGDKGFRRYEVDNQGRVRSLLAQGDPLPGKDLELTIDLDVQQVAEESLSDAMREARRRGQTKARAGAAVVIEVETGAIIAMASAPTYDPSAFLGGISDEEWEQLNAEGSEYPLTNRAVSGAYPPGSTFKAVVALAALQSGIITPNTTFYCPGRWSGLGAKWAKWCWLHSGHDARNLYGAMAQSCDSYFYEVGKRFYEAPGEKLQEFSRSVGFGDRTGIDVPGEVKGRVPDAAWKKEFNKNYPEYQQWLPGDTVNISIGQGDLLVTPLQLASYYAALGNGGEFMQPHILKAILGSDGAPALEASPTVSASPGLTPENLATLRRALVGVTTTGTGASAMRGFPISVAGKTGTSQMTGKDDYAWFACYAPANQPKYAVVVMVEQGGHGGSIAEPAARHILSALFDVRYRTIHATDSSR